MAQNPIFCLRQYLGIDLESPEIPTLSILCNKEEISQGKEILNNIVDNSKPTIGIYTFATGKKCFSKEWWKEIYNKMRKEFGDKYHIVEVLPMENVSQIDFAAPSYYSRNLREMTGVMENFSAFLTADCGVMHLASCTNPPIVSLFATTNPRIYRPYNPGSIILKAEDIKDTDEIIGALKTALETTQKK